MSTERLRTFVLVSLLAIAVQGSAQTTTAVIPVDQRGPAVGQHVPEFRAPDQTGRERSLESLRGRKGLVLLFVRSADW